MPKMLKITCSGEEVYLLTDSDKVYNFYINHVYTDPNDKVHFLDILFPDISVCEEYDTSIVCDCVVCLCHFGIDFYNINVEHNFAIISTNERDLNIRDVNVLLSTIISKKLNLRGKSFLHCSAVEKEHGATVIIGDSGAGKTSLAVYLCRYFNYKLICNDHAIVGLKEKNIPYLYSGTLWTALRPGAVKMVAPELLNVIPQNMLDSPWKVQFLLNDYFDELGIKTGTNSFIYNLFFVMVDDKISCCCNKLDFKRSYSRETIKLYNFLGEFTRSNGKFLFGINRVFPNFDNNETDLLRQELAKCIIDHINAYEIRGDIKYVAHTINDLYSAK